MSFHYLMQIMENYRSKLILCIYVFMVGVCSNTKNEFILCDSHDDENRSASPRQYQSAHRHSSQN